MPRRSTWNVLLTAEKVPRTTDKNGAGLDLHRIRPAPPLIEAASAQAAGLRTLDDGRADQVAPLGPGAVVVADLGIAHQVVQHEPRVARPLTDPAVGDDVVARFQAQLVAVDLDELV